jgi:hypothetical protein
LLFSGYKLRWCIALPNLYTGIKKNSFDSTVAVLTTCIDQYRMYVSVANANAYLERNLHWDTILYANLLYFGTVPYLRRLALIVQ